MPVTEFAVISLRGDGFEEIDFLEALMDVQEIQDSWTRINYPYNLDQNTSLSSMYIEHSDPPSLLITAPWDSAEAHHEWIQASENQTCNSKLSHFIKPGCNSVLLLHLAPAGKEQQLRTAFLNKESFNVARITIDPSKKAKLQEAYEREEKKMDSMEGDQKLWAGWTVEMLDENEELVVFWTDDWECDGVESIIGLGDKVQRRRFRHVV
jgi:heme-degrading monooxygenase HmoA